MLLLALGSQVLGQGLLVYAIGSAAAAGRRPGPADPAGDLRARRLVRLSREPVAARLARRGRDRRRAWCSSGCPSGACASRRRSPVEPRWNDAELRSSSCAAAWRLPVGENAVFDGWTARRGRCGRRPARHRPRAGAAGHAEEPGGDGRRSTSRASTARSRSISRPSGCAALKIREKIRALVWHRLRDHGPGARSGPPRRSRSSPCRRTCRSALRIGWRTADLMWRIAGDTSTDFNHYTKRITLGAVYALDAARLARRRQRRLERHRRLPRPPHRRCDAVREMEGAVARASERLQRRRASSAGCATRRASQSLLIIIRSYAMPRRHGKITVLALRRLLLMALVAGGARAGLRRRPRRRKSRPAGACSIISPSIIARRSPAAGSINQLEYDEMIEFSSTVVGKLAGASRQAAQKPALVAGSRQLRAAIAAKAAPADSRRQRQVARQRPARRLSGAARARQGARRRPRRRALRRRIARPATAPRARARPPRSPSSTRRRSPSPTASAPASAACSGSTR